MSHQYTASPREAVLRLHHLTARPQEYLVAPVGIGRPDEAHIPLVDAEEPARAVVDQPLSAAEGLPMNRLQR